MAGRGAADHIQEAVPACVQGPPLGLDPSQEGCSGGACDPQLRYSSGTQGGNPGAQQNPSDNQVIPTILVNSVHSAITSYYDTK